MAEPSSVCQADFATGDKGGDLIDLVRYLDGGTDVEACNKLADWLNVAPDDAKTKTAPIKPKVMLITMFAPEAQHWIDRLELKQEIRVPGLSAEYPTIRCNTQQVCLLTTGMGQTNAAASTLAWALSPKFDLRKSYFLIAGIAGISPKHGTIGTAAWAHYLVEFGTQWEIDSRDAPSNWPTGYLGINTKGPNEKPPLDYKTEVFELNPKLQAKAFARVIAVAAHLAEARTGFTAVHQSVVPFTFGYDGIRLAAHGLVVLIGGRHGQVMLHQLVVIQHQLLVQLDTPTAQADFGEMPHDQPGLDQHLSIACAIG